MSIHELKTDRIPFIATLNGWRNFEVVPDNPVIRIGDQIRLTETLEGAETGRAIRVVVNYKILGDGNGIDRSYCVLGTQIIRVFNCKK